MNNINIIPTTEEHLDAIAEIEAMCFSTPWSRNSFADSMSNKQVISFFTATLNNEIVGYICLFHLFEEGELLNIAVKPNFRNCGIAQKMINKMFELFKQKEVTRITLELRESNINAKSLYLKNGFEPIGIRKNYYTSPLENGIVMQKNI
ncbi:MAG: ribosomal protein S18-alanine N-acetyltransferase [Clostridia bacterium]|nr:ribosomal protein S18-alanine N-acetyltransferase [Clostridia bacterium]